jgi:hypothetical protein
LQSLALDYKADTKNSFGQKRLQQERKMGRVDVREIGTQRIDKEELRGLIYSC